MPLTRIDSFSIYTLNFSSNINFVVTLQFAFKLLSTFLAFYHLLAFCFYSNHCATFDRAATRSLALPFARSNYVVTISLLGHILPHSHTHTLQNAILRFGLLVLLLVPRFIFFFHFFLSIVMLIKASGYRFN